MTGGHPEVTDPATPAAKTRRIIATFVVAAGLLYGSAYGTDDLFPFGPMVQFAFRTDPNGGIRSTFIDADTTTGQQVRVRLSPKGVGIGRAEIEGQLGKIKQDPSLLQSVAVAQRRLHPEEPQFTMLYLRQHVIDLVDGVKAGEYTETLVVWQVRT
jgi:hypothetical protein